jgi:hypothetical protein
MKYFISHITITIGCEDKEGKGTDNIGVMEIGKDTSFGWITNKIPLFPRYLQLMQDISAFLREEK